MTLKVIKATFDGEVFRPAEPVDIAPNTVVELTVEPTPERQPKGKPGSFFDLAGKLLIDGPPDWSENVDKYLYGEEPRSDR